MSFKPPSALDEIKSAAQRHRNEVAFLRKTIDTKQSELDGIREDALLHERTADELDSIVRAIEAAAAAPKVEA